MNVVFREVMPINCVKRNMFIELVANELENEFYGLAGAMCKPAF